MLPAFSALTESKNFWCWEWPLNSTNSWSLQPRLALTFPSSTSEYDIQQITSLCLHLDGKVPAALQEPLLCSADTGLVEATHDDQSLQMWTCFSLSVKSFIWFFCSGSNPLVLPGQAAIGNTDKPLPLFNPHPQAVSWLLSHPQAELHAFHLFYPIKGNSTSLCSQPGFLRGL